MTADKLSGLGAWHASEGWPMLLECGTLALGSPQARYRRRIQTAKEIRSRTMAPKMIVGSLSKWYLLRSLAQSRVPKRVISMLLLRTT